MTNREKLQENYEDSFLALLMDEFAQSEGKRYNEENERLRQMPDAAVPEEIEKRALQLIDQRFSRRSRRNNGGKLLRFLGRLAIAAVIAALLFGAAFALSETVRAGTLNLLMQIDERIATWRFAEGNNDYDMSTGFNLVIDWLPEGYAVTSRSQNSPSDVALECTNDTGGLITVSVHDGADFIHTLDLEEADYYSMVVIQDCDGILRVKDGFTRITWPYNNSELVVSVRSSDVNQDTLLCVAESVIIVS